MVIILFLHLFIHEKLAGNKFVLEDLEIEAAIIAEETEKVSPDVYRDLIEILNLDEVKGKKIRHLSKGYHQRLKLFFALSNRKKIIILDEPFNAVDLPSREKMIEILADERKQGKDILIVVHNINPILHEIDKVLLMNRKLIAYGEPREIINNENLKEAYGTDVQIIVCEEGYCHPLLGDEHAG